MKGKNEFYFHNCEKFYPTAISISNNGKKVIIARGQDGRVITFKLHKKGKKNKAGKTIYFSEQNRFVDNSGNI